MHTETNRTSTCHHSVPSVSTIIPFGRQHDHVGLPCVASYPPALPQKQMIFNESKTRICLDDTRRQEHSSDGSCRAAVYAYGLRRRPECVHFRQRGLKDVAVLSHEIVIVRASRRDAHRDRYLLRIHLLFRRVRMISAPEYLSVSLVAGSYSRKSEYRADRSFRFSRV